MTCPLKSPTHVELVDTYSLTDGLGIVWTKDATLGSDFFLHSRKEQTNKNQGCLAAPNFAKNHAKKKWKGR